MAQDYYDSLQVLDHIASFIDDNKAELGLRYVAKFDEDLLPQYPAILINMEGSPVNREWHATQLFLVHFTMDIWILHANLSAGKAVRNREDIELATGVRKLLHSDRTLGGHIVDSWVELEQMGRIRRGPKATIVSTRLSWRGQNRVPMNQS